MATAAERQRLSRKRKKLGKMVIPWFEVTTQEIDYLRQRGYGAVRVTGLLFLRL